MQDDDALLDDRVGFEIADALNIYVEVVGLGVVVERLVWVCSGFPISVIGDGPVWIIG